MLPTCRIIIWSVSTLINGPKIKLSMITLNRVVTCKDDSVIIFSYLPARGVPLVSPCSDLSPSDRSCTPSLAAAGTHMQRRVTLEIFYIVKSVFCADKQVLPPFQIIRHPKNLRESKQYQV